MKIIRNKINAIANSFFTDRTLKRDNLVLLFSIVTLGLIFPLFGNGFIRNWLFNIVISAIIISGVTSLKFQKKIYTYCIFWSYHVFSSLDQSFCKT